MSQPNFSVKQLQSFLKVGFDGIVDKKATIYLLGVCQYLAVEFIELSLNAAQKNLTTSGSSVIHAEDFKVDVKEDKELSQLIYPKNSAASKKSTYTHRAPADDDQVIHSTKGTETIFADFPVEYTESNQRQTVCIEDVQKMANRAEEIKTWKIKIENTIEEIADELNKITIEAKRMQKTLNAYRKCLIVVDTSIKIVNEINVLESFDKVKSNLHQESNNIKVFENLMNLIFSETENQIRRLHSCQNELLREYNDKWKDFIIKDFDQMKNISPELIVFHSEKQTSPQKWFFPEIWISIIKDKLSMGRNEMDVSKEIRAKIGVHIENSCRCLQHQQDQVDVHLVERINDVNYSLDGPKRDLKRISKDIVTQQKHVSLLKQQIVDQEITMKKVHMELYLLNLQPNKELCMDERHMCIVEESRKFAETMQVLRKKLAFSEDDVLQLFNTRNQIEREIKEKERKVSKDEEVRELRKRFPKRREFLGC